MKNVVFVPGYICGILILIILIKVPHCNMFQAAFACSLMFDATMVMPNRHLTTIPIILSMSPVPSASPVSCYTLINT